MASTSSAADIDPRDEPPFYPVDLYIAAGRLQEWASYVVTLPRIDYDENRAALSNAEACRWFADKHLELLAALDAAVARAQRAEDALAVAQSDIQHYQHSLQSASNQVEHWKREAMRWTALHGTEGE